MVEEELGPMVLLVLVRGEGCGRLRGGCMSLRKRLSYRRQILPSDQRGMWKGV